MTVHPQPVYNLPTPDGSTPITMTASAYMPGEAIYAEIRSQPEAWEHLLAQLAGRRSDIQAFFEGVQTGVFGGCGSGLNAALYGARLFQSQTGIAALAAPAADLTLFPESLIPRTREVRVVLFSRSGRTTEVVEALDQLQTRGIQVLGITCTRDSPLAEGADATLLLEHVTEEAITTTRSFTGMVLAAQCVCGLAAGQEEVFDELQRLPDILRSQMALCEEQARELGEQQAWERVAFVANGPSYGLARECQLKIMETCRLEAQAYPLMDFRHGPQATVSEDTLLVVLSARRGRGKEIHFAEDMRDLGARIWVIGSEVSAAFPMADHLLDTESLVQDEHMGPLYLPPVHFLAYYRAMKMGLDPDRPANLSYWIETSH